MTGKTHKQGGMLISIVGFAILRAKGLLLPDVNLFLQWLIIYPFCIWGSVASDLDHHWEACPQKDYPSWILNHLLHITAPLQKLMDKTLSESQKKRSFGYKVAKFFNASHRSWQTHSDLTLLLLILLLMYVLSGRITIFGTFDIAIIQMVITGVVLGGIAHFILDMLTPEGIWLAGFSVINTITRKHILPYKMHLVPHTKAFATGGKWELFIRKVLQVFTVIAIVWFLITIFFPNWKDYIPFELDFTNLFGG